MVNGGHAALALAATLLAGASAQADEALFKAMAMLTTGGAMAPPGEVREAGIIDIYNVPGGAEANVTSLGTSPCAVQKLMVAQKQGGWAQTTLVTFDFSKASGFRYLADTDDFLSAPSRGPDDPAATSVNIDGKAWLCQNVLHVDPAQPRFDQFCDDGWTVVWLAPEEKKAIADALALIATQCFGNRPATRP